MIEMARPAGDIASRSIRITLGGREHVLAVLFIAGNERWREYERKLTEDHVNELIASGNDTASVLKAFANETDVQLDILYAYDTDCGRRAGALPPREELKESIYDDELEAALREVVKAANPKAASAALRMMAEQTGTSSTPTSMSPRPTAGRSSRSAKH